MLELTANHAPVRRGTRAVPALLLGVACGATQSPAPQSQNTEQLKALLEQRQQQFSRWTDTNSYFREICETRRGDCRLEVSEKRARLIRNESTVECRDADREREATCLAKTRLTAGDPTLAIEYVESELWCLEGLLKCVVVQQAQAQVDSSEQQASVRREEVESSARGVAARARLSLGEAEIAYLRATLPPDAEAECTEKQPDPGCREQAQQKRDALDQEYRLGPNDYRSEHATERYERAFTEETACLAAELECLKVVIGKYGETPESRRWVDKNRAVLRQRQELLEGLGAALGAACIEQSQAAHQPQIIQRYLAYVREPVLFFRIQLHRAFLGLHQAQLDCLKSLAAEEAVP